MNISVAPESRRKLLPLCEQFRAYNDPKTALAGFDRKRLKEVDVKTRMTRGAVRYAWINVNCCSVKRSKPSPPVPLLSEDELDAIVTFMDTNGDGEVTLDELMTAIRRAKRMNDKLLRAGKRGLRRLLELIESRGMTLEEWFEHMDGGGGCVCVRCVWTWRQHAARTLRLC